MLINSPNISGSLTVTGNSVITGSLTVLGGINGAITGSAATASYVEYTNVANKPTLVSGSSQVTYSGLTGIPSGIVSGSSQVTYSGLTGIPAGIVSGSAQVTALGFASTGSSNTFQANQIITGSLFITQNLVVGGSSSIQYINSSVLDIADNIITVNAFNPGVRFGGLAVIDSGSSPQVSGSLLFDSIKDQWIFVHQNQSVVTSSVLLMGPETYNDLGNESYLSANRLPKGSGVEHLRDSNITDTGTVVSVNSNTAVTGSFTVVTGSVVELQVTNLGVNLGSALTDSHIISGSLRVNPNGLFVSGSGNVGIGIDTPSRKFQVREAGTSTSGDVVAIRNDNTSSGAFINFIAGGSNAPSIGAKGNNIVFTTDNYSGTELMRITSTGNLGLGVTPSAWSVIQAMQVLNTSWGASPNNLILYQSSNVFYDGAFKYITTGTASQYRMNDSGIFSWLQAPSGTAGNAISFTQAMTLDANGRLGIGATSPSTRLHVEVPTGTDQVTRFSRGPGNAGDIMFGLGDYGGGYQARMGANQLAFEVNRANGASLTTGTTAMFINTSGNVGIGTTSPGGFLELSSANSNNVQMLLVRNFATSATGNFTGFYTAEVRGASSGNLTHAMLIHSNENNSGRRILDVTSLAGTVASFISNGNVGINTSSPTEGLVVSRGALRVTSQALDFTAGTRGISIDTTGGDLGRIYTVSGTGTATDLALGTNNTERMRITTGGNVSIGHVGDPNQKLRVQGVDTGSSNYGLVVADSTTASTMYVRNDGAGYLKASAWSYGSDLRIKENISNVENGIEMVLKMKPKHFDYIDGQKNNLGFIAQDIQEIIPQAVSISDEKTGILALKTDFLVPYLVKAIQELKAENDTLKSRIDTLEQA